MSLQKIYFSLDRNNSPEYYSGINDEDRIDFLKTLAAFSEQLTPHFLEGISYASIEISSDICGPLLAAMAKAGFRGTDMLFEVPSELRENDYCAECRRRIAFTFEEENAIAIAYRDKTLATCSFVMNVQTPGKNTRDNCIAIMKYDYSGKKRTGVAYRWQTERSEERSFLCDCCIDKLVASGDLQLVEGACDNCGDFHEPVRCALCAKPYGCSYNEARTQATDCASNIFTKCDRWWLVGHYGSSFDMLVYSVEDATLRRPLDPICDLCIESMAANNQIVRVSDDAMRFDFGDGKCIEDQFLRTISP